MTSEQDAVGPPLEKKRKITVPIHPKVLNLPCEWEECEFITKFMDDFIKHIAWHLSTLVSNVTPPEQVLGCFNCKWRGCDVAVIGHISDFTRHVYFHTFHTKIKCIGEMLIKNLGLHTCNLDGQSCNLIPDLPERLQCGWHQCGAIYDNPEFFYQHVDFHADVLPVGNALIGGCQCQWSGCDVNVKSKHKLRDHLRSHTQQKLVACPNCGGLFANRTKFFDHLERQMEESWYQCSHCNKKFQTERLLRDHIRIHVNSYKCPLCEMTCPNPHGLRNHLLYKHTTERQFACPECEYKAKTQACLQRHMETHSENVLMCHEKGCGFVSRLYQCLAAHYQKVHQGIETKQYMCHICNQCFNRGGALTKHLQKVHNYKWPAGYSRFRYTMRSDGYLRLQTVRYESVNLIEQVIDTDAMGITSSGNPETSDNVIKAKSVASSAVPVYAVPSAVVPVPLGPGPVPVCGVAVPISAVPVSTVPAAASAISTLTASNVPVPTSTVAASTVPAAAVPTCIVSAQSAVEPSSSGVGGAEVSTTYNLEMLGDVALLTPNKLGIDINAMQATSTSGEDATSEEESPLGEEVISEEELTPKEELILDERCHEKETGQALYMYD